MPKFFPMRSGLCFPLFFISVMSIGQTTFESRGIGGGGAMFNPSIHPGQPDEVYIASDLGGLYYTHDGGLNYDIVHFTQAQTTTFSKVCHTAVPGLKYALLYRDAFFSTSIARSTDNGVTWTYVAGDQFPDEEKWFLFADYDDPSRLIWTDYATVFFSKDGGMTASNIWSAVDNGAGILVSGVYWDGDDIYIGTNDGVIRSHDGGTTFSLADYTGIPSGEVIIGFGGGSDDTLTRFYALTGEAGQVWVSSLGFNYWELIRGVYRMDQLSGTWEPIMNGIELSEDFVCFLGMATNDPYTCYLAGSDHTSRANVLKTTDGGATWERTFHYINNENIYTGYSGQDGDLSWWWGGNALGFTVNERNSLDAMFTDYGFIHRTLDGGATWRQAYLNPADENPPGLPTPKRKYYRGIGMEQTAVWQVYWFDKDQMFGCFTDISGVRSVDGGNKWSFDYSGHDLNTMYRIAKHPATDLWFGATSSVHDIYQTTYITDNRLFPSFKDGHVLYTNDHGENWQILRDFDNPVIWVETSTWHPDKLYVGVLSSDPTIGGIWRADGVSDPTNVIWNKLNNPPANNGRVFNIHALDDGALVTTWSARRGNNNSVFSDSSGVFLSTDGGMTWSNRSHPQMRFWTKDLVIDPSDPSQSTWYACVWSGWGGQANDLGRLWRTTDRGLNWQPMTGSKQFHRVSSVAIDPLKPETMYLTTELEGLWVTHNKSDNTPVWELVEAYPFGHPERVFFNPFQPGELWVASFGNGMRVGQTSSTGIHPFDTQIAQIRVLQNPITDILTIECDLPGKTNYRIINQAGISVAHVTHTDQVIQIPVGGLPSGWYIVEGITDQSRLRAVATFVIQR